MLGAIIGDIIGSHYEWYSTKNFDFQLFARNSKFTDDTVMTIAVADSLLYMDSEDKLLNTGQRKKVYACKFREYGRKHPNAGYGSMFKEWLKSDKFTYMKSYGNGAAMRVTPIGFAFDKIEDVLREAKISTSFTHNHRESVKGAQAVASAVFLARHGESKDKIKSYIERKFGYNLSQCIDDIRPTYGFDSSCKGSVPQSIIAFLESEDFESAVRKAISLGGDADTMACISGGIAHAFYGSIPENIVNKANLKIDYGFKRIIKLFNQKYGAKCDVK